MRASYTWIQDDFNPDFVIEVIFTKDTESEQSRFLNDLYVDIVEMIDSIVDNIIDDFFGVK